MRCLTAGGNIALVASGAGQGSNLTVQGSDLSARSIQLQADNQVQLLAAQDRSSQ